MDHRVEHFDARRRTFPVSAADPNFLIEFLLFRGRSCRLRPIFCQYAELVF